MKRHFLRKSTPLPAAPLHVLVGRHNQAVSVLRGNIGKNKGPYQGTALDKMPENMTVEQRMHAADAPAQVSDITRNLFESSPQTRYWTGIVQELFDGTTDEIGFRQQLFQTVREGQLDPLVGKTMLRRSVQLYKRRQGNSR